MKYRESDIDKKLRQWFSADMTKAHLRRIRIVQGNLRGLNSPLNIAFDFPITAFAGINGAGKSTLLALACCAYHGPKQGFKLPRRKTTYYTFSDFFIQHKEEPAPGGVEIRYGIAFDKWRVTESNPDSVGIKFQSRYKKAGGKWNEYKTRVKRTVLFLGIDRIVPHSERSQSRSYSRAFKDSKPKGWEDKVREIVGFILNKTYDDFRYLEHSRYTLPLVKVGTLTYSGFNMGAGENALFEIFSTIYSCGGNALLVMDEIELGLHAKAQINFIQKLKEVCIETGTQVICTTHSREIFGCLPDEARFFIENVGGKTKITPGISPEFAFAKLGARGSEELTILVEDEVAKRIIQTVLPAATRTRMTITVIGSAGALARQLAAAYARKDKTKILAVFDGDQRANHSGNLDHAHKMSERPKAEFQQWYSERVTYLPGDTWPEAWLIQTAKTSPQLTANALSVEEDTVLEILEYGLQAGKHKEFHEIAQNVGLDKGQCLDRLCATVFAIAPEQFSEIESLIKQSLVS